MTVVAYAHSIDSVYASVIVDRDLFETEGEVRTGIVTHDQSGDLDILDSGPPWYDSITGDRID